MSGRRRPTAAAAATKGLVAHVDDHLEPYGPEDGEPVGVPAPCDRLIAGYWCTCGSGFAAVATGEPVFRARVVEVPLGAWRGFVDDDRDSEGWFEPVHRPGAVDRDALQRTVQELPVGTVVERSGVGLAPAFRGERPC